MARFTEYAMYILFGLALLPFAALEAYALGFFLINPAMLEVRDAALEAPAVFMAMKYASYLLVPAAMALIYVLVAASLDARVHAATLMVAFCISLYLISLAGRFAFNSWQRLYLESVPIVALIVLDVVLLIKRWLSKGTAPRGA
jgi:hypothetical protein